MKCPIVQSRASYFIDSHFTDIWSDGDLDADKKFGCKVVHAMRIKNGHFVIDGFMKCLQWYIWARLEPYGENYEIHGRDMILYIIYGTDDCVDR
jgi:hypothetical protein